MRRVILLAIAIAWTAQTASVAGPLTVCSKKQVVRLNAKLHGCVYDFTHNHRDDNRFWSPALCSKRGMYVYVPPGFDPAEKYPLMIWLHGFLQDEKDFRDLVPIFDNAIACGQLP